MAMEDNKELTERMDYLDEVVNSLIKTNAADNKKSFDNDKMEALFHKMDLLVEKSVAIDENLKLFDEQYNAQKFANIFETLDRKIAAIPKVVLTRHRHGFESKSWGYLGILGILMATIAITAGYAISYRIENQSLSEDAKKYEIVRGIYLKTAEKVDHDYLKNADSLKDVAAQKIKDKSAK
jgi:hypothetical protein